VTSRGRSAIAALFCWMVVTACTGKAPDAKPEASDPVRAAREAAIRASCRDLPTSADLQEYLRRAPAEGGEVGGLFGGKMEWAALVNRNGELCAVAAATEDAASAWPAGQALAKAKAFTANAYSTDAQPLSTARLYTLAMPGHSLWGSAGPNEFNPACLDSPQDAAGVQGKICGGIVTVGGGVPLYRNRRRIGGLGVGGDTPCADHEIAKRIRHVAQLDPERGPLADDISYTAVEGASVFTHPLCPNTWLNGRKVGDEPKAASY
jgi:uncharacterized protein GlcG (DUF336 family)